MSYLRSVLARIFGTLAKVFVYLYRSVLIKTLEFEGFEVKHLSIEYYPEKRGDGNVTITVKEANYENRDRDLRVRQVE